MKKTSIGGMALIEGIMMRGTDKIAIAVKKTNGEIAVESKEYNPGYKKYNIHKIPILRGIIAFFESMIIGSRALFDASKYIEIDDENKEKKDNGIKKEQNENKTESIEENKSKKKGLSNLEIGISLSISLIMSLILFFIIPNYISNWLFPVTNSNNRIVYNLMETFLKFGMFLTYIIIISNLPDIKRVFMYHGAEHKVIATYESGEELTVENIKKHSRLHPRCGTSFIILVLIISMIIFFFIWFPNFYLKLLIKLTVLPIIAGISYEAIKIAGRYDNVFTKLISYPGILLQNLTTKEPDDSQIEVAIKAIEEVIPKDGEDDKW